MANDQSKPRGWCYKPGAPVIRGYDTLALFRHASLERIKYLANQIRESQRSIEKLKSELSEGAQRTRRLSKDIRQTEPSVVSDSPMKTLRVKLSWHSFSEILDKYHDRVLDDINAGRVIFGDRLVTLHIPVKALGKTADTVVH